MSHDHNEQREDKPDNGCNHRDRPAPLLHAPRHGKYTARQEKQRFGPNVLGPLPISSGKSSAHDIPFVKKHETFVISLLASPRKKKTNLGCESRGSGRGEDQ